MFRAARSLTLIAVLALLICLAAAGTAQGKPTQSKHIPPELAPPASAVLLFELGARGVQIYSCEAKPDDPTVFAWALQGPEAELFNVRGEVVGSHFAGPTWQGQDGSSVVGMAVARVDAPNKKAIPWLLLEATAHPGGGAFSTITHIQRLDTEGGVAPSGGCDAPHAGEQVRVPYEATYAFYYPAVPAA